MKVEALHFTRCCCCIPLRYGLLFTGYLKLVLSLVSDVVTIDTLIQVWHRHNWLDNVLRIAWILVFLADTALSIVLVIGCHKKNSRLLKIFNYSCLALGTVQTSLWLGYLMFLMYQFSKFAGVMFGMVLLKAPIVTGFINAGFLIYLFFLIRSEIMKLENNCEFRFNNNRAEAECSMMDETSGAYNKDYQPADRTLPQPDGEDDDNDDDREDVKENTINDYYRIKV